MAMMLTGERRGGSSGGSGTWVLLDEVSQRALGRKYVGGKTIRELLDAANIQIGDQVVVKMENARTPEAVYLASDYTGTVDPLAEAAAAETAAWVAERAVDEPGTIVTSTGTAVPYAANPYSPPEGMFPCVPEADPDYIFPEDHLAMLGAVIDLVKVDSRVNVLFTGPQGTGKTTLARAIAEELGWSFVKVESGAVREPGDWFTRIVATNGSTHAVPTQLVYGMVRPRTVILLDEINRTSPANHNSIYGLLDELGRLWSDDLGCYIERAPEVLVIATANVGEDNIGVYEMDAALTDRFPFQIELSIPGKSTVSRIIRNRVPVSKKVADALAELNDQIKDRAGTTLSHVAGTRPLIAAAKLVLRGLPFDVACSYTVAATYSKDGAVAGQDGRVDSEFGMVQTLITGVAARLDAGTWDEEPTEWAWGS